MFHYQISLLFFRFFSLIFASNFLLHFDLVIFASKQNKAKRNSSLFFRFFRFFKIFFRFFSFFSLFSLNFRFASIFHLIFAYFTFVFASDFWCFTSKWIMWNQAFFSLRSETKFSLQFQVSLPKRKWGRTLLGIDLCVSWQTGVKLTYKIINTKNSNNLGVFLS